MATFHDLNHIKNKYLFTGKTLTLHTMIYFFSNEEDFSHGLVLDFDLGYRYAKYLQKKCEN